MGLIRGYLEDNSGFGWVMFIWLWYFKCLVDFEWVFDLLGVVIKFCINSYCFKLKVKMVSWGGQ